MLTMNQLWLKQKQVLDQGLVVFIIYQLKTTHRNLIGCAIKCNVK